MFEEREDFFFFFEMLSLLWSYLPLISLVNSVHSSSASFQTNSNFSRSPPGRPGPSSLSRSRHLFFFWTISCVRGKY